MKKIAAVLAVAALFALAVPLALAAGTSGGEKHDALVQVLSVDLEGGMLTFKNDKGEKKTAAVLKEAQAALKTVKAGESVVITCLDNANGDHTGISAIKPAEKKG
ncbi:MAG TPA: hypothetical protein VFG08_03065 [Candidatus Polarisedimenticolia bacterium]|nr:hypothetical protein [Candidatus Polarisedimenticolia bacterium]